MDRHTNAVKDCNEEIVPLAPQSALAFAFNFAIDSAEKWNILSRNLGPLNLFINFSGRLKGRLTIGPSPSGNQRLRTGGREMEMCFGEGD